MPVQGIPSSAGMESSQARTAPTGRALDMNTSVEWPHTSPEKVLHMKFQKSQGSKPHKWIAKQTATLLVHNDQIGYKNIFKTME